MSQVADTVNTWHLWVYRCRKPAKTRLNRHLWLKFIIPPFALREASFMKSFPTKSKTSLTSRRNRNEDGLINRWSLNQGQFQLSNQPNHAFALINIQASHPTLAASDQRLTRDLDANNADDQHGDEDPRDWRNRILEKD